MKAKTFFFLSLFISIPIIALADKKDEKIEINTTLMGATFKIVGKDSKGKDLKGTVFIIGKRTTEDRKKGLAVLVTAAHVLEGIKGDEAILFLRIKTEDSYKKFPFPLHIRKKEKPLWVRHPDVDVAAMWVSLPAICGIKTIATDFLIVDNAIKEWEIHPGDQLFCLGYPYGAEANEAGFPILRSGNIASYPLLPTEKTKTFVIGQPSEVKKTIFC